MANETPLTISDAESAYKAITELIISFEGYPTSFEPNATNVRWNMIGESTSIGLFPLSGAIYLNRYIDGTYKAQLPFQIIYKTAPTNNKANIYAQDLLSNLAMWLEVCGIEFESGITLESINRTSPVYVVEQDNKNTLFAVNMQLVYQGKRG